MKVIYFLMILAGIAVAAYAGNALGCDTTSPTVSATTTVVVTARIAPLRNILACRRERVERRRERGVRQPIRRIIHAALPPYRRCR